MTKKLLIPLYGNDVAPRFDLATEVLIVSLNENRDRLHEKTVVLPQASAEQLCHLILTEEARVVICGGIEEEYYQFLRWKRVEILDSVIGPYEAALERFCKGSLRSGEILYKQGGRGS
ncbi:MAG: dinitrogenase iron-molybdenum cofactor biosynthesis protein [Deltaproteobacteria bacterium]|nr:dinitrogenase iron-molybdenum cofactor biosynthesis protein [Deltaproteobacteria bacterium]